MLVSGSEKMEAEDLAEAIADLDRRERVLVMELKDVLTDVSTPESSDVEDDEVEEVELPQVRAALQHVEPLPRHWTEYSGLYESEEYRSKAKLKIRFVKKLVRTVHLRPLMMSIKMYICRGRSTFSYAGYEHVPT